MDFQIIDLDGCICDDRWRLYAIDHSLRDKRGPCNCAPYARYHDMSISDTPANLDEIRGSALQVVNTLRPSRLVVETLTWLRVWAPQVRLHSMAMPEPHDHRGAIEIKRAALQRFMRTMMRNDRIVDAIDDREDIVNMYRELGLPARVVQIKGVFE